MKTAFERLIEHVPVSSTVLDIGYGGLGGQNTTDFLRARFKNVEGLCKQEDAVRMYQAEKGATDIVHIGEYPQHFPDKRYDFIVHDTNIEGNLELWTHSGLSNIWDHIYDGGFLLTYIMMTDFYGEPETHKMIADHRTKWWALNPDLPIFAQEHEERRFYISWVLLKKP